MAKGFNRGSAAMGGQGGMMQQIQKLQKQMEEAQAKLAEETVSATAGGGAIKVTMTGDQKCEVRRNLAPNSSKTPTPKCCKTWSCPPSTWRLTNPANLQEKLMGPLSAGLPF